MEVIVLNHLLHQTGYDLFAAAGFKSVVLPATPTPDMSEPALRTARVLVPCMPGQGSAALFDAMPALQVVSTVGVGYEQIDIPAATARGIPVVNQAGVGKEPVAEHAIGLMLSLTRRIPASHGQLRLQRGNWNAHEEFLRAVSDTFGTVLKGKTLGIVGFGHIGRRIAEICRHGFQMEIAVVSRSHQPAYLDGLKATWHASLTSLCAASDFVVLTATARSDGKPVVTAEHIAAMKRTAFLINVARGTVIDQRALYEAVANRKIAGAGLDVFDPEPPGDDPILHLDNVVVTPHCAGLAHGVSEALSRSTVEQALRVLRGERPPNLINAEVWDKRRR